MAELETKTPVQLARAASVSSDALILIQEPDGPGPVAAIQLWQILGTLQTAPILVSSRAIMAALEGVGYGQPIDLTERGREGTFVAVEETPAITDDEEADPDELVHVRSVDQPSLIYVRQVEQLTPYHGGYVEGETTPAQLAVILQNIADYCAGGRAGLYLPEKHGPWVTDRMLRLPDGFRGVFDGLLRNGNPSTAVNAANVIATGEYAVGYTSPGWTAGTPVALANCTVTGDELRIAAGATGDALIAAIKAGGVRFKLFVGSKRGYTNPVGANGAGGAATFRHILQWMRVADLSHIDSDRLVLLDAIVREDIADGVCGVGASAETGIAGHSFYWADDIQLTGKGGIESDFVSYARNGGRNIHLHLGYHRGHYGFGGNGLQDSSLHFDTIVATEKLWDFAGQSANLSASFVNMSVVGSKKASSDSSFNENANGIAIEGDNLTVSDSSIAAGLFKWTYARSCGWDIKRIRARKITSPPLIVGAANAGVSTFIGGPVDISGNWCAFDELDVTGAPISRVLNIPIQHGSAAVSRFEMRRGRVLGNPSIAAALLAGGDRTLIAADFQNGDVVVTTATASIIRCQLENGRLNGQTSANVREAIVNGSTLYPGSHRPATVDAGGAVHNAAVDAARGRVAGTAYESWISVINASGIAVQTPSNAVEGRELTLRFRNRNATGGAAIPISFSGVFVGAALVDVQPLRTSIVTMRYDGARWIATSKVENQAIPGPNLVADPNFNDASKWTAGANTSVEDGFGRFAGTTAAANLTPHGASGSNQIAPMVGRSYQYSFEVRQYVSGSVKLNGGGVNTEPLRSENGVSTGVITAVAAGSFTLVSGAGADLAIDNLSIVEL